MSSSALSPDRPGALRARASRLARLASVIGLSLFGACGGGDDGPAGPARPTLTIDASSAAPYGILVGIVSGRALPASGISARIGPDTAIVRRVDDSTLAVVMPELPVGPHQLRVAFGTDTLTAPVQTLAGAPVADPNAFVGGRLDVAQADLDQLDAELAAGMSVLDADTTTLRADIARARTLLGQARARLASSTPEERAFAARVLAANAEAFGLAGAATAAVRTSGGTVMLDNLASSGYCIADDGRLLGTYEECSADLVLFGRRRMREIAILGAASAIAYVETLSVLGAVLGITTGVLVAVEVIKVGRALYRRAVVPAVARVVKLFDFSDAGDLVGLQMSSVMLQAAVPDPEYFVSGRGRALRVRAEYRSLQGSDASVPELAARIAVLRAMESIVNGIRSVLLMSPMAPLVPVTARQSVIADVPSEFLKLGDIAPSAITGTATVADSGWVTRFTRSGITADIPFTFDVDYTATGLPARTVSAPAVLIATPRFIARSLMGGKVGDRMCATDASGASFCWGRNAYGRLGDVTTTDRALPTRTRTGLDLVSLTGGDFHTCGLTASGVAQCWGYYALGDTTRSAMDGRLTSGAVRTYATFSTLVAGRSEVCGLSGGTAICWGGIVVTFDTAGTSGRPRIIELPNLLPFSPTFTSIDVGSQFACGVTASQEVRCFGDNRSGRLGDGTTTTRGRAVAVAGGRSYMAVAVGDAHACALTTAGAAYCWGANSFGQIGDAFASGAGVGYTAVPTAVSGGLTFTQIEAGGQHTCALTEAGKAYCWGDNVTGQSTGGSSTGGLQNVPAPVLTNVLFKSLSAGSLVTCGIARTGGGVYCWGSNNFGEAGIGATSNNVPVSAVVPPQL